MILAPIPPGAKDSKAFRFEQLVTYPMHVVARAGHPLADCRRSDPFSAALLPRGHVAVSADRRRHEPAARSGICGVRWQQGNADHWGTRCHVPGAALEYLSSEERITMPKKQWVVLLERLERVRVLTGPCTKRQAKTKPCGSIKILSMPEWKVVSVKERITA